jgi:hypothetical protein
LSFWHWRITLTDDQIKTYLDTITEIGEFWSKDKDYYISCFGAVYAIEIMALEDI